MAVLFNLGVTKTWGEKNVFLSGTAMLENKGVLGGFARCKVAHLLRLWFLQLGGAQLRNWVLMGLAHFWPNVAPPKAKFFCCPVIFWVAGKHKKKRRGGGGGPRLEKGWLPPGSQESTSAFKRLLAMDSDYGVS